MKNGMAALFLRLSVSVAAPSPAQGSSPAPSALAPVYKTQHHPLLGAFHFQECNQTSLPVSRCAPEDLGARKSWKYRFHGEEAVQRQVLFPNKKSGCMAGALGVPGLNPNLPSCSLSLLWQLLLDLGQRMHKTQTMGPCEVEMQTSCLGLHWWKIFWEL